MMERDSDDFNSDSSYEDAFEDTRNLAHDEDAWADWRGGEDCYNTGLGINGSNAAADADADAFDESDDEEPCSCLFCSAMLPSVDSCLDHMRSTHSFDFASFAKTRLRSVYGAIAFVNYLRRGSVNSQCALCLLPITKYRTPGETVAHVECALNLQPLPDISLQVCDVDPKSHSSTSSSSHGCYSIPATSDRKKQTCASDLPADVAQELSLIAMELGVKPLDDAIPSETLVGLAPRTQAGGLAACGFWSDPVNLVPVVRDDPLLSYCAELDCILEDGDN